MSWKDYQTTLLRPRKGSSPQKPFMFWGLGALAAIGLLVALFGIRWFDESKPTPPSEPKRAEVTQSSKDNPKLSLKGLVQTAMVADAPEQLRVQKEGKDWTVDLTLDHGLQRFISSTLAKYKTDWAGVSVIDPKTGRVLALSYHSEKEPESANLALRATFPAASVFKIVTAAAAMEETGLHRDSKISFGGNMYGINKRQVMRDSGQEGLTLDKAFAKSANVVFGKIGATKVNGSLLQTYAERFGFNSDIPFELAMPASSADIPKDDTMEEARTAAGFGDVTLSPLHGSLMAASILNEGMMMEPYIISKVQDAQGEVTYTAQPRMWRQTVSAVIAREMRRMMMTTVLDGTAHRSFRKLEANPILNKLQMGGKTGSLTGKNPRGKTEWFVGYARSQDDQIAVGIVIVNDKVWRLKPAELVKDIFEFYFSPRPVLEANANLLKRKIQ